MAKQKGKPQQAPKQFNPRKGRAGELAYTLTKNDQTGRFDLKSDKGLVISSVNPQVCLHRGAELGVVWQEED